MATYSQYKHVELYKIGHGKNRVPNAPRGCISEIFNGADIVDGHNGMGVRGARPARSPRDSPTRPRDTHSRLFGQAAPPPPVPMVTDNVRSNIKFGEPLTNGAGSPNKSPPHSGSAASTPSRGEHRLHCGDSEAQS